MRDLAIITPSRGRPWHMQRLMVALADTCQLDTALYVYADEDDPRLDDYKQLGLDHLEVGPRDTLAALTNRAAAELADSYQHIASLGDDHVPRTAGWDRELCAEIGSMGGTGFAYGAGSRWVIPEAVVVSSDIVKALGWFMNPACMHYKVDDTWLELGLAAKCISYRHDVLIEHMQFGIPYDPTDPGQGMKAVRDDTYTDALQPEKMTADLIAWHDWRKDPEGLLADAGKIRALIDAGYRACECACMNCSGCLG
jgi:hypothetical protein